MGTVNERRVKCHLCGEIVKQDNLLRAKNPFAEGGEIIGCPKCYQCDEGFSPICDEPGCNKVATSGRPSGNPDAPYRIACFEHGKNQPIKIEVLSGSA